MCTTLTYPKNTDALSSNEPHALIIEATGVTGLSFTDSVKVNLLPSYLNPDLTFIQTDKSVYKPGQLGNPPYSAYHIHD